MSKSSNFATTLTIIYLALVALCFAIFHLIIRFVPNNDHQNLAVNLLSWSATLFATIALLYTFNSWKEQKRYELSHSISSEIYTKIKNFRSIFINVIIAIHGMYETKEIDESVEKVNDLLTAYYDDLVESYEKLNHILKDEELTNNFIKLIKILDETSSLLTLAKFSCRTDNEEYKIFEKMYENGIQEAFDKKYKQLQTLINAYTEYEDLYRETILKISLYKNI